jgi:predicted secreted protein
MIILAAGAIAFSISAAAFAQQSVPAPAAATAPAAAPQAAKPKPPKERVICETEQVLGSLLPRHLCMTESQWDAAREGARRAVRDQAQDVEPRTQSGGH